MALGYNLVVLPPTSFDFSSMQASSRQAIVLARRIDVTGFEQVGLQVRVHSLGTINANNNVVVKLATDGYPHDDPSTDFGGMTINAQPSTTGSDKGAVATSATISNNTTAPSFLNPGSAPANFGGFLQVYLDVTNGVATSTFTMKLSIDLTFKTAGVIQRLMPASFLGYGARRIL